MAADDPHSTHRTSQFLSLLARAAVPLAALSILNAFFAAPEAVARGRVAELMVPVPETLIIAWVTLLAGWAGRRGRPILAVLLVSGTGVLLGYALAEAFFQYIYARPFVPRVDIPMVRGGLLLLFGTIGALADRLTPLVVALLALLLALLGGAVVSLLRRALGGAPILRRRRTQPRRTRRGTARIGATVLTAATIGAAAVYALAGSAIALTPRLVAAVAEDGRAEFRSVLPEESAGTGDRDAAPARNGEPSRSGDAAVEQAQDTPRSDYRFPGLRDRDIYLFAIEAYGYAAHSREALSGELRPTFRRLEEVFAEAGYTVLTSYLRSPVAGGFSWLAEATFFTGQWVDSQRAFEQLYGAGIPTLTGMLQQGGYYTMTLRPGTVHGSWPEGWELYRFEESLVAHDGDFNYVGPWFSFVPITDQFTVWTAHNRIEALRAPGGAAQDRPLLVHYQLVSSHTPFNRIPPLIEPWDALGDGSIYHERSEEILTFDNTWTGGEELEEGYVAALEYVFAVLTEYVDRYLDHERNPLVIIFGDHQAQRPIREPDAALSVPIHVATRDEDIAARFRSRGFRPGMMSNEPPPHRDMSAFFPLFADLAGDPESVGVSSGG